MEKNRENIKDIFQTVINKEFDKFEELKFRDRNFKIAVRKDEVPMIEELDVHDNYVIILFHNAEVVPMELKHDFEFVMAKDGSIKGAVFVINEEKEKNPEFFKNIDKCVQSAVRLEAEPKTYRDAVELHIKEKIGKAITKIIKAIPQQKISFDQI